MVPSIRWSVLLIPLNQTVPAWWTVYSYVTSQQASYFTSHMLPQVPQRTCSSTLLSIVSSMLPIILDHILPAFITVCSQVCCQNSSNYTLKYSSECTWWCTPSSLDCTLCSQFLMHSHADLPECPHVYCWICFQIHLCVHWHIHFEAGSHTCSQFHWIVYLQPSKLYTPKYTFNRHNTS